MIFSLTAQQMIILFLFMAIGYFLMKKHLVPEDSASVLSKLLVMVFMPPLVFETFAVNLDPTTALDKLPLIGVSVVVIAASYLIGLVVGRALEKERLLKNIYIYALTVPNLGYLGYPLVGAVLGQEMLLDFMIMVIPANIFIYTAGICMLHPNREFSFKKLINPPIIGMIIGILFGLFSWPVPEVLLGACSSASACMAPCAMLLAGFVLAKQPVKEMLIQPRSYFVSALRLLVLPLGGLLIMRLLNTPAQAVILATIELAMPFGLNTVVFPEAFGGDSTPGARLCFLGNLLALITIPLIFIILSNLYGI